MAEEKRLVAVDDRAADLRRIFAANKEAMVRSIPRSLGDGDRLLRIAYNTIAFNGDLVQCTRPSLIGGVMEALKMGITIGGPMQESWLLPFRNKQNDGTYALEATLIVGYMGYRNIIDRGRAVIDMHPRAVYDGDEFDVDFGSMPTRIRHKPYFLLGAKKGRLLFVYCIARLRGGGVQVEVMPTAEVEEHRNRSRAKDAGPWKTDYDAMALKTVIRKIAKYLPKSSEILGRALDLDEKADRGESQEFDLQGIVIPGEGKPALANPVEALKDTLRQQQSPEATETADASSVVDPS